MLRIMNIYVDALSLAFKLQILINIFYIIGKVI